MAGAVQTDRKELTSELQKRAYQLRRDVLVDREPTVAGYRAIVAVPLAVQDRVLGVLEVLHHRPRDFGQEDVEFVEALATQAALAIDNARLLAQMQARLRESETLLELGQTVIPALDLAERMRLLARGASRAFGADTVGAYLADAGGACLMPVAGYRVPARIRADLLRSTFPIADHAILRRLIGVAGEIADTAYDLPDDVDAALDRAESMVFEVNQHRVADTLSPLGPIRVEPGDSQAGRKRRTPSAR